MKVIATVRVDIDTDAWTLNYGVTGNREIRQDVVNYITSLVEEHLKDMEVLS